MKKMIIMAAIALLGLTSASSAATPQCGLFKEDSGHVTVLESDRNFVLSDLEAKGGFLGRDIRFGCWMDIGRDRNLRGSKMYSYVFTDPSGVSHDMGPYGIQEGGMGSGFVQAALDKQPIGQWSFQFFLVDRANYSKQPIGSTTFGMQKAAAQKKYPALPYSGDDKVKCGIYHDEDGTISVKVQGKEFSEAVLDREGLFSGAGYHSFGCWTPVGKSDAIRQKFMYSYTIISPDGSKFDQGPYGIWKGGSCSGSIIIPNFKSHHGVWSVEYYTVSRDNGDKSLVGKSSFLMKE